MPKKAIQLSDHFTYSRLLRFVLPCIGTMLFTSIYGIVDGLCVSNFVGKTAFAAVNLIMPLPQLLGTIGFMLGTGGSAIVGITLGEGDPKKADRYFTMFLLAALISVSVLAVLGILLLRPVAVLLGAKGVTYQYTIDYLRGLAPFALCFIISYNMEVLIKTDGYPRLAILTVVTGCLANCVLDYIAIFLLDWGVWGAAVATGLSQLLTCIIYLRHFLGGHNTFHFVKFRMDWGIYKRLIPLGFADGVTELCNGVMIFLFNRIILQCLGDDGLVSYTIIAYVNTLIINTMLGISQGSQPLVSYHYGKGDAAGYKKLLRYGFTAVGIMTAVIFAGVMLFAPQIAGIFVDADKPWLAADTAGALWRYGLCYILLGSNILMGGFLTAVERPKAAISISVGRGLLFQAGALLLLAAAVGGTGIWFAPVISEALCAVMAVWFLRRFLRKTAA